MESDISLTQIRPSMALRIANVAVASSAVGTLCGQSDQRQFLQVQNVGLTTVWLGVTSSMTTGPTGLNIGSLAVDAVKTFEAFGDFLYARYHGASDAGEHVMKVLEY